MPLLFQTLTSERQAPTAVTIMRHVKIPWVRILVVVSLGIPEMEKLAMVG